MSVTMNTEMRLMRAEAVTAKQRAAMPDAMQQALRAAIEANDADTAADIARAIRNRLLQESDGEMQLDRLGLSIPSGTTFTAWLSFFQRLGEALGGEWAAYRQRLRDLPAQDGFPFNIEWPVAPGSEGSGDDAGQ